MTKLGEHVGETREEKAHACVGGRAKRPRILLPLRHRDFGLLYTALTVSLLGDGVYRVALAWQVFDLSNAPAALAVVGAAWMLSQVLLSVVGGVLTDRLDRRLVLITADVLRALAVGVVATLSLTDTLELWHLIVLVIFVGAGDALFLPAATAIVPALLPKDEIVQANALNRLTRPLCGRFLGPAAGGALIALTGTGSGFAINAASFAGSAVAVSAIRAGPAQKRREQLSILDEILEGWRFVRAHTWLWATLLGLTISLLAYFGPVNVLVPYLVRERLHEGAETFGAVLAAGGAAAIITSAVLGQRGLPRRHITLMYVAFAASSFALVVYAVGTTRTSYLIAGAVIGAGTAAGQVVWGSLMQQHVPDRLLGRVAALDYTITGALIPLSYILTAPVTDLIGARATLLTAGLLGGFGLLAFLLVPDVRALERE